MALTVKIQGMSTGERAPLAPSRYTVKDKGGGRDDAARPYTMGSVPGSARGKRGRGFFAPIHYLIAVF